MLSTFRAFKKHFFTLFILKSLIFSVSQVSGLELEASSFNFYNQNLENLSNYKKLDTSVFKGFKSVWVAFEKDCTSCKKQLNDLKCLSKEVKIIALGATGARQQLVSALRTITQSNLIKLKASKKMRDYLDFSLTPTTYLVNSTGEIIKKVYGRVPCHNLKKKLDIDDNRG